TLQDGSGRLKGPALAGDADRRDLCRKRVNRPRGRNKRDGESEHGGCEQACANATSGLFERVASLTHLARLHAGPERQASRTRTGCTFLGSLTERNFTSPMAGT